MVLDTHPWRVALVGYFHTHNLPLPHAVAEERGFDVRSHGPLRAPGHHAVARMQRHAHASGHLAEASIDGTLNTPTQHILIPPLSMGDQAVKAAMGELGVHEDPWGSNRGTRIHEYQAVTGAYNTFWCASFFWWSWVQAGYRGSVSAGAWATTDSLGKRITLAQAVPGCGVSFDIGDGHVGMFLARVGSQVKSVDGNTRDEVAVRLRPISEIHSICLPHG